jgi:hypothetical protein
MKNTFARIQKLVIGAMPKIIFLSDFAGQLVLKEDPMVLLDGARPQSVKEISPRPRPPPPPPQRKRIWQIQCQHE